MKDNHNREWEAQYRQREIDIQLRQLEADIERENAQRVKIISIANPLIPSPEIYG